MKQDPKIQSEVDRQRRNNAISATETPQQTYTRVKATHVKACPFCKDEKAPRVLTAEELSPRGDPEENSNNFVVCCDVHENGCGGTGGFAQTSEQAIKQWNRRGDE